MATLIGGSQREGARRAAEGLSGVGGTSPERRTYRPIRPDNLGASNEDEAFWAALRARDPGAIERLYDAYGGRAFGLAYRITGDRSAAEDVVQDAFLALWQQSERLRRERGRLLSLLLTVVHNKAIDRIRQQRNLSALYASSAERLQSNPGPDTSASALTLLDRDAVRTALAALPEEQRQTIHLAYFDGYTHVEIAAVMKVPLGTVKSRMRIGLERLRSILRDKGWP